MNDPSQPNMFTTSAILRVLSNDFQKKYVKFPLRIPYIIMNLFNSATLRVIAHVCMHAFFIFPEYTNDMVMDIRLHKTQLILDYAKQYLINRPYPTSISILTTVAWQGMKNFGISKYFFHIQIKDISRSMFYRDVFARDAPDFCVFKNPARIPA